MADATRIEGQRVYCHQCAHEWDRAHGGLTCPRCDGEFVEVLEPGSTSPLNHAREPSLPSSPELSPPLRPLFDHNPWNGPDDLDPDSDPRHHFTTFEFTSDNGGRVSFSTRSIRTGGFGQNNRGMQSPFESLGPIGLARSQPTFLGGFPGGGFPGGSFPGGGFPRDPHGQVQQGNLQDLFSLILQSMQQPVDHVPNRDRWGDPQGPEFQRSLDLLSRLFNPANAQRGDMVFSDAAFDRVLSDLMNQGGGSTAPPPASADAIRSLPQKKIDLEMLGPEGKAECSICMDNVELDDEVTVLPCNHWFHGNCVTAWLKEHDTCPHCRKPITSPEEQAQQPAGSSRRRPSRRASSVSSPRVYASEGSRNNPFVIPESPSDLRQARQSYYGRRRDSEMGHPETLRLPSSHSDSRGHGARSGSGESGSSRGSNNGGGGVTGWIRDHLPFS